MADATEDVSRNLTAGLTVEDQAALLDLAHDAIFVRELATGAITYWNRGAQKLYGWIAKEALGRVSHQLLQTEFPLPLGELEDEVIATGAWEGELVQTAKDGRQVTVLSRWAPHRDNQGQLTGFLEINRDITPRKAAEDQVASLLAEREARLKELGRAHAAALESNRQQRSLNTALQSITSELNLGTVLQRIADEARELIGARYAALGVADESGRIQEFITSGITQEERAAIGPLPQGHGLLGVLIRQGKPLRVPVIKEHPESHGFPPNHPAMTSLLGVPIFLNGRPVGDLYLTDKIGAEEFSQADEDLLMLLANQAAVAIHNAWLYEQVREARDQVREWNRVLEERVAERTRQIEQQSRETTTRVVKAQEDERKRIARELHDESGQALAAMLIDLDLLQPLVPEGNAALRDGLARLRKITKRTWEEIRSLAHDLRPSILDDFGLAAALEALGEDYAKVFGIPITVEVPPIPEGLLASDVELTLYRVAQEALTNSAKHADATAVNMHLAVDDRAVLSVSDNGRGFQPDEIDGPSREGGWGLRGIRERANLIGASLRIESTPGQGASVVVEAPLQH